MARKIGFLIISVFVIVGAGYLFISKPAPHSQNGSRGFEAPMVPLETGGDKKISDPADSPFGFHSSSIIPPQEYKIGNPYAYGADIGVRWERPSFYFVWTAMQPDINRQKFDWDKSDLVVKLLPDSMQLMANLAIGSPRRDANYLNYVKDAKSFLPKDQDAYRAFVMAVVERYDGDGVDDMPDLSHPVKYWQVDNEPPHGMRDYDELLVISYEAIKRADPEAKVVIGGVPGFPPTHAYMRAFDREFVPILASLAKKKGRYFDIFDFHWYGNATGDYLGIKEVYEYIDGTIGRLGLQKPEEYWITEMGTYSGDPTLSAAALGGIDYPFQSERQQAADIVKRSVYSVSLGVKKIFFAFGLKEGFRNDGGYFDYTGLIYDGNLNDDKGKGVKKLGYFTYKKMTEVLDGSDWDSLKNVVEDDGIFVYQVTKKGKKVWIAWNDGKERKTVEIRGIDAKEVSVIEALPRFQEGSEIEEYSTAFVSETRVPREGIITISIDDSPIFIEER